MFSWFTCLLKFLGLFRGFILLMVLLCLWLFVVEVAIENVFDWLMF